MSQVTEFQTRRGERRSGEDRRSGVERRHGERRRRAVATAAERRTGPDRRQGVRRSGLVRRRIADRRGDDGRRARLELSAGDRARARRLPEAFVTAKGTPAERIAEVVHRMWTECPAPVRAGIAEGVLPILRPLLAARATVTPELRDRCEEVVARWLARVA